jgi:phosphatidylglycerophosphate synthase
MSATPAPADRRPIFARDWRVSHALAGWLARRGVTANAVSLAGMVSGVLAGACLAATSKLDGAAQTAAWLAGAVLIQLRLLANMLDGMVAVATGTASPVGELYNEVPDRVSDAATLAGLGYAAGGQPELGLAAALVAVFVAYARAVGKAAGGGQQWVGPMAKQQRMFLATACALYCGFAPAEWQPAVGLPAVVLAVIVAGGVVTAARRLLRTAAELRERGQ